MVLVLFPFRVLLPNSCANGSRWGQDWRSKTKQMYLKLPVHVSRAFVPALAETSADSSLADLSRAVQAGATLGVELPAAPSRPGPRGQQPASQPRTNRGRAAPAYAPAAEAFCAPVVLGTGNFA